MLTIMYNSELFIETLHRYPDKKLNGKMGYILGDLLSLKIIPDIESRNIRGEPSKRKLEINNETKLLDLNYKNESFTFTEFATLSTIGDFEIYAFNDINEYLNLCQTHNEFMNIDCFKVLLGINQYMLQGHKFIMFPLKGADKKEPIYPNHTPINEFLHQHVYEKPQYQISDWYECSCYEDYILSSVYHTLQMGYSIKKCENCGKFFVPENRSDTKFCDRISPQDSLKTCKEYGKYNNYLRKLQNDQATKLYKQIYNIKANRVKRCDNIKLKNDFNKFKQQASQWKSDVKSGIKTNEEYLEWLQNIKSNR